MQSSLIPERPLVISPTLAATIGLEEAVMLHVFSELMAYSNGREKDGLKWVELSQDTLVEVFPFWAAIDIRRVQNSLQNIGLILVEEEGEQHFYAINQRLSGAQNSISEGSSSKPSVQPDHSVPARQPEVVEPRSNMKASAREEHSVFDTGSVNGASYIPVDWQPGKDWIKQCRAQNIPEEFVHKLVPGFVLYWRERKQSRFSWGNAFYKFVLREWRNEQTRKGMSEIETTMSAQWWPSIDAITILENSGVSAAFIEDAVPEFVLYWRERGGENGAWNTRFIEHIRRQWSKYSATLGLDSQPRIIATDWQPSAECFDILRLAEIDEDFARTKVKEFVLYWRDTQQAYASWNTRFLQYIKYQWARQLESSANVSVNNANDQSLVGKDSPQIGAAYQRFTDRSWAE